MLKRFLILSLLLAVSVYSLSAKNDSIVIPKKHEPKKATLYSAILPGLGQAYNKKYWKVPIVYAGIGTIGYVISMNSDGYRSYRLAYDYKTGINTDVSSEIISIANRYSNENLIRIRDSYRRNVELSWIVMALWYGINIIDATVDAHFFEYDIGDDLSLMIEPTIQSGGGYGSGGGSGGGSGYGYGYGYGSGGGYGYGKSYGVSLKLKF